MKFFAFALLALAQGSFAKKLSHHDLNNMVQTGQIDQKRLVRSAVRAPRELQNNYNNNNYNNNGNYNGDYNGNYNGNQNNANQQYNQNVQYNNYEENDDAVDDNFEYEYDYQEYENYEEDNNNNNYYDQQNQQQNQDANMYYNDNGLPFNGDYTVRFNKCLSYSIEDPNLVEDNQLVNYAKNGALVSQKSFVLFDLQECEPGNCVFDELDYSSIYMVPLEDFIQSFIDYFPNKKAAYCEQCMNQFNYCLSGNGKFFDEATFRNNGAFCYEGQQYEMINCSQCSSMGCYANNQDGQWEGVSEWVEEVAACKQTESYWLDYSLYTGLMCNEDGDGVEFGVFVDEDCQIYHRQKSFHRVISNDDWSMLYKMPSVIEFMFTSSISCWDESEVSYINAYQPMYTDGNDEGNDCELGQLINESCENLFQYNSMGYSIRDCMRQTPNWYTNNGGDNYNQYTDKSWKQSGLYKYEISASSLNNMGEICHIVANSYASKKSNTIFSAESMFNYDSAKNNYYEQDQHDTVKNAMGIKDGLSFGEKLVVYPFCLALAALIGMAGVRLYKFKKQQKSTVEVVDKDLPLMS